MKFIKFFDHLQRLINILFVNFFPYFTKNEFYQPSFTNNKKFFFINHTFKRDSDDRLDKILMSINKSCKSYLDVGSQHGFFVFNLAKQNIFSFGIEADYASYKYSKSLQFLCDLDNVNFIHKEVNFDYVKNLPNFDVVTFLSVFHHIVFFQGKKNAINILKELCHKTNKVFFFETGEYQEKGFYWTSSMSFLGNDTKSNMISILQSFNCFKKIIVLGSHKNHLNSHRRLLFKCEK